MAASERRFGRGDAPRRYRNLYPSLYICRRFLITYLVKPWLRRCELLTRTLGAFLAKQTSYEPILGVEFTDTTITSTVPGFGYGLARESVGGVGFEVGF